MTYTEGGYREERDRNLPPLVRDGCEYYIPPEFAAKWKAHLDWLNEALDSEKGDDVEWY